MLKHYNPASIAPPLAVYNHAVEAPANARWLHVSGQVGIRPDGNMADGPAAQAEQTWQNVVAILADAGMTMDDVVKINSFLTSTDDIAAFREARDRHIGEHKPASTMLVVAGLARPDILMEVEVIAAKG